MKNFDDQSRYREYFLPETRGLVLPFRHHTLEIGESYPTSFLFVRTCKKLFLPQSIYLWALEDDWLLCYTLTFEFLKGNRCIDRSTDHKYSAPQLQVYNRPGNDCGSQKLIAVLTEGVWQNLYLYFNKVASTAFTEKPISYRLQYSNNQRHA